MKDGYTGKFVELDFPQNHSPVPKHEVNSAHVSGKQFFLHCVIVESVKIVIINISATALNMMIFS